MTTKKNKNGVPTYKGVSEEFAPKQLEETPVEKTEDTQETPVEKEKKMSFSQRELHRNALRTIAKRT